MTPRLRLGAILRHRETGREYVVLTCHPDGTVSVLDQPAKAIRVLRPSSGRALLDVFEAFVKMGGDPCL